MAKAAKYIRKKGPSQGLVRVFDTTSLYQVGV